MSKKIVCPDCETENESEAKKCTKCSLPLEMSEVTSVFDFFRVVDARDKFRKREDEKNRPPVPQKKRGLFQ